MFYSGNDNYMQDFYFNNQMPMQNYYNTMAGTNNMENFNLNGGYTNNGYYPYQNIPYPNQGQSQSITYFYPDIYRILMPVISRVVANTNLGYINNDLLNNMVDTVYNITEGEISIQNKVDSSMQEKNIQSSINTNNQSNQSNSNMILNQNQNNLSQQNNANRNISQDIKNDNIIVGNNNKLLKDLIKILIIKEIASRINMQNNINAFNMNYNRI